MTDTHNPCERLFGESGVEDVSLVEATRTRYLNYALSVVTSRALPDVRDGLKPVQRRLLYGMFQMGVTADARYRKCAAVVGEVMGKYHPHGDASIYDAMVRMAQSFSLRYPLVDGHGNFGSLDGDGAAAMRYTECRLSSMAGELLNELKQDTVNKRPNYDGQYEEPEVLPAQVPTLLLNGSTGIAVGLATNIPPHNMGEIIAALQALITNPELPDDAVADYIKGPDFPTGGEILNTAEELRQIMFTGRGTVKLRGEYHEETRKNKRLIIITSVPYGIEKGALVEKIGELISESKIPQLIDARDESTTDVRIVLELKNPDGAKAAMAYLYKHTALQQNFHVNLTCLVPDYETGKLIPGVVNVKDVLVHFLNFRMATVERRLQYDLDKLNTRLHILNGFVAVFADLDAAIALIRESPRKSAALEALITRFNIDEEQANAVLELKLHRLAQLEMADVESERATKQDSADRLSALLSSDEARWDLISEELAEINKLYGDARRSAIVGPRDEEKYNPDDFLEKEDTWVIITRNGRVKRQKTVNDAGTVRVQDGDSVQYAIHTDTTRLISLFTAQGRVYAMRTLDIPQSTGNGEPIQTLLTFKDADVIVGAIHSSDIASEQSEIVIFTKHGRVSRAIAHEYGIGTTMKTGKRIVALDDGDAVVSVALSSPTMRFVVVSDNACIYTLSANEIALRTSGTAKGSFSLPLESRTSVIAAVCNAAAPIAIVATGAEDVPITVRPQMFKPGAWAKPQAKLPIRGRVLAANIPKVL